MKNLWAEKENIFLLPDCLDWELLSPDPMKVMQGFWWCHYSVYYCSSRLLKHFQHKLVFPMFSPLFSTTLPEFFHSERCFQLTKIEMMPLNFSSTKSQIILLLKYWTGSHCKDKKSHFGENNSRLEKQHANFRSFQRAPVLNNLSVKAFSLITFVFLTLPLLKSEWRLGMALLTSSCLTQLPGFQKEEEKESSWILLFGDGGSSSFCPWIWGREDLGSYRDALGLVLLLLWLQGELDEELLQLFIAIINTKLLKAAKRNQKKTQSLFVQKEVQTAGAAGIQ